MQILSKLKPQKTLTAVSAAAPIVLQFPMNENPPIVEADVSRYQALYTVDGKFVKHFNWKQYATKSRIATIRAVVANAGFDWEFEYNLAAAAAEGVFITKIYLYVKLNKNLDTQADAIALAYNKAKEIAGDHYLGRIVLDIEENADAYDKNKFTGNAEKLVSKVYAKTGVVPTIYTRAYFWNGNTYKATWMKECALWDAHHFHALNPAAVPVVRPYVPDAWADVNNPIPPVDWQFDTYDDVFVPDLDCYSWGSTGDNEIDLNFFVYNGGTPAAFKEFYGIDYPAVTDPAPPPPPPPDPEPTGFAEILGDLNVRVTGEYFADNRNTRGVLKSGDVVEIVEEKNADGYIGVKLYVYENARVKRL